MPYKAIFPKKNIYFDQILGPKVWKWTVVKLYIIKKKKSV